MKYEHTVRHNREPTYLIDEKKSQLLSIINTSNPKLVALAWHNFLKSIEYLEWDLEEAETVLTEDLEKTVDQKGNFDNVPALLNHENYSQCADNEQLINSSVDDLKLYMEDSAYFRLSRLLLLRIDSLLEQAQSAYKIAKNAYENATFENDLFSEKMRDIKRKIEKYKEIQTEFRQKMKDKDNKGEHIDWVQNVISYIDEEKDSIAYIMSEIKNSELLQQNISRGNPDL